MFSDQGAPPWLAVTVPPTVNVPLPAFAVTVPLTGCVTPLPSTSSLPLLPTCRGETFPDVIDVGEVLNCPATRSSLAGELAFCPAASRMAPAFPTIRFVQFPLFVAATVHAPP